MMKRCVSSLIISLVICVQINANEFKLRPGDPVEDNAFGQAVAIDGEYAIVGCPYDDGWGLGVGAAYIFYHDGNSWVEQIKLQPHDPDNIWQFGYSVDITADYAIVGGPTSPSDQIGAAYIFHREGSTWTEVQKLMPSAVVTSPDFGESVAIEGQFAVVGAPEDGTLPDSPEGTAFIFQQQGDDWIEIQKIMASDGTEYDDFGQSVSISGDYILVGSPGNAPVTTASGSAYLFHYNGVDWDEQDKVWALDDEHCHFFGYSVAISGDKLIVGDMGWTPDVGNPWDNRGSAYIFSRSGISWSQVAHLIASDGASGDNFGRSVDIGGTYVIVGSPSNAELGNNAGAAYLFELSGGEVEKFTAGDGDDDDAFGMAVSICDGMVLVGQPWGDEQVEDAGYAYVYDDYAPVDPFGQDHLLSDFQLHGAYPNPFNPTTIITLDLPVARQVNLQVFDTRARSVASHQSPATSHYAFPFDATGLPSGIYLYRLTAGEFSGMGKMVLLK